LIAVSEEAREAYKKLNFFKKIKLLRNGEIFLKIERDSGQVAVFLGRCKKHGLYIDYGRNGRACPKCAQITKFLVSTLGKKDIEIGDVLLFAEGQAIIIAKITDVTDEGFGYITNEGGGFSDFSSDLAKNGVLVKIKTGKVEFYMTRPSFFLSKVL
jgi:hypothetical protein